jgi:hypothetical protein
LGIMLRTRLSLNVGLDESELRAPSRCAALGARDIATLRARSDCSLHTAPHSAKRRDDVRYSVLAM